MFGDSGDRDGNGGCGRGGGWGAGGIRGGRNPLPFITPPPKLYIARRKFNSAEGGLPNGPS